MKRKKTPFIFLLLLSGVFVLSSSLGNAQVLQKDDPVWYVDTGDDASCPEGTFAQMSTYHNEESEHFYIYYEMCGHYEREIHHGDDTYIEISIPGIGVFSREGEPELPSQGIFVPIPLCSSPELSVVNPSINSFDFDLQIFPGQPVEYDTELGPPLFTISEDAYAQDAYYPSDNFAEITETAFGVDGRTIYVRLNPVRYNPYTGGVDFVNTMEVDIDLTGELPTPCPYILPVGTENGAEYLIIVDDTIYNNCLDATGDNLVDQFANWKTQKGISTRVESTVAVYNASGGTLASIDVENFIQEQWDNWIIKPKFLLLIGDHNQIPSKRITRNIGTDVRDYMSDFDYSLLQGDDRSPDLYMGRLPVDTGAGCAAALQKTLSL